MPSFMLHFACTPSRETVKKETWTADCCINAVDMEEAENRARDLIASHAYEAGELIAFAALTEESIPSLEQTEATLYLRAQQSAARGAVLFSDLHQP